MNYEKFKKELDIKIHWYQEIYYWFYRRIDTIKSIPREIKWFIQRGRRGYADCDVWSFDWYLTEMIPKALRQLEKHHCGCPTELYDETKIDNECWKWEQILKEIAKGFDEIHKVVSSKHWDKLLEPSWSDPEDGIKAHEKDKKSKEQFKKSMDLFVKYFTSLWD